MTGAEAEIVLDMHAAGRDVPCEAVAEARRVLAVKPTPVVVALADLAALEIELGIVPGCQA